MADLVTARDVAAQVELMAALRKSKAALDAFRALAESSGDTSVLSHFRCLDQDGIVQVVATATTAPAALPWQNAPPICNATVKLVTDAFSGLHCTTYWLHHAGVRKAVFATLVVAKHLDEEDSLRWAEEAEEEAEPPVIASDGNYATTPTDDALPILAPEIWLHALSFVKRSWWNPCLRRGHR
eukprot:gene11087-4675_t